MYNYNGESMKKDNSLICNICNLNDIKKISGKTKYINISLEDANGDVFSHFIDNGSEYSYAESFDNLKGYIYVDYDTFIKGELQVKEIIEGISSKFNELERLRYIYITLGKIMSYDINVILEKNDYFTFDNLGTINNMWGSLSLKKVTNLSIVKIFKYLCNLLNIDCDIVTVNDYGYLCNKVTINNQVMILDLMKDIPFIKSGFITKYFGNYNDDYSLDKKIGYINEDYNDRVIDKIIKNLTYDEETYIQDVLYMLQNIVDVNNIGPIELGIILDIIFKKYFFNGNVTINNLYINDKEGNKEHFVLITGMNHHYGYNFKTKSFVEISKQELIKNLDTNKIGIYLDEIVPDLEMYNTRSMA